MSASPTQLQTLNEADYRRYRVPEELASFGSLETSAGHLPLQQLDLTGRVSGLYFHLRLRQRFYNAYSQPLEAVYIFPLPSRAAVSAFVMQTQQRRVVGQLQERGEARRQYQQAVSEGKQAALAEEDRSEVFTMTVGNIPPGEWVDVELEMDGPLLWADGQAMFRFPLVVAPRYIPGTPYSDPVGSGVSPDTNAVPDASRISPPILLPGYPNPVQLRLELQVDPAGLQLGQPRVSMPEILCLPDGDGFRLYLEPTADRVNRDIIVRFPLDSDQVQAVLQVENSGDHAYFGLNLVPDSQHIGGFPYPRQVVTLLDRSGSMEGWKMVCARRAVGRLIDCLTDADSFQVLNFDTVVEPLDPWKTGLRPATDRERFLSIEQLGRVTERGGTEILPALQAGVALLRAHNQPYLLLITDGQVGNEAEVLRWIQQHATGIRIFTVGIDSAVNVSLLERIAQVSGGHFTLVESEEQLDAAMLGLRRRISPPLLSNLRLELPGAECSPAQADLYPGNCTRLLGRFTGPTPDCVELVGTTPDGEPWRRSVPVALSQTGNLRKLWARERVLELEHGFLAGWRGLDYQPAGITRFALEHGVLCRFTAFVAIDEERFVAGQPRQVTQAVSQPEGWGAQPELQAPGLFGLAPVADPFASAPLPMACAAPPQPFTGADPFASACDPFGGAADAFRAFEPAFESEGSLEEAAPDPFAAAAPIDQEMFAPAPSLAAAAPARIPPSPPEDELEALLSRLEQVSSREELLQLLDELLTLLESRGQEVTALRQLREDFEQASRVRCDEVMLRQVVAQVRATWDKRAGTTSRDSFWM